MARNKEEALAQGEAIEEGLGKPFPIRREVDDFIVGAVSGEVPQSPHHHIYANHHAGAPSIGVIVDSAVGAVVMEVVDSDGNQAFLLSSPQNRTLKRRVEDFRHSRKHVNVHGSGEPQKESAFFHGLASCDGNFRNLALSRRKEQIFHFHGFQYDDGGCGGHSLADCDAYFPHEAGHGGTQFELMSHRPNRWGDSLQVLMQGRIPLYFD